MEIISDYLATRGYRLIPARNGQEALERFNDHNPDLIIMDIQMPEIDGLKAIQQIRAMEQNQHIPIIAVTALAMPGDRDKCLAAGADKYLSKPVGLRKLTEAIEDLLSTS